MENSELTNQLGWQFSERRLSGFDFLFELLMPLPGVGGQGAICIPSIKLGFERASLESGVITSGPRPYMARG